MKRHVLAVWSGEARPQDTWVSLENDGGLRIVCREQWIQCDADEFLLGALFSMRHDLTRRKPMQKWATGLAGEMPDNARLGLRSSVNGTTHQLDISYSDGIVSLEELSVGLKLICTTIAGLMEREGNQYANLVAIVRSIWWD